MGRLVSVASVRERIGFVDDPEFNGAIAAAIDTASNLLAAQLGSDFDQKIYVDRFICRTVLSEGQSSRVTLRLNNGFVNEVSSIKMAPTFDFTEAEDVPVSDQTVDKDRGYVTLYGDKLLQDRRVQVTYTAGFEIADETSEDYENVPRWLQSLASDQALYGLYLGNQQYKPPNWGPQEAQMLMAQITAIVNLYSRNNRFNADWAAP